MSKLDEPTWVENILDGKSLAFKIFFGPPLVTLYIMSLMAKVILFVWIFFTD